MDDWLIHWRHKKALSMDAPYLLNKAQMRRIEPFFLLSHGVPRVHKQQIVSAIIYVIKHGLMRRDAPKDYEPDKTIYNRSHGEFLVKGA